METVWWLAAGMVAVQALDILGHVINARKIRALRVRVEESVARAESDRDAMRSQLEAARAEVAEVKKALEAGASTQVPGELRGGHDPAEFSAKGVEAREKKKLLRAEGEAAVAALLGEYLPMVEGIAPAAVDFARSNPALAERVLAPLLARIRGSQTQKGGGSPSGW